MRRATSADDAGREAVTPSLRQRSVSPVAKIGRPRLLWLSTKRSQSTLPLAVGGSTKQSVSAGVRCLHLRASFAVTSRSCRALVLLVAVDEPRRPVVV